MIKTIIYLLAISALLIFYTSPSFSLDIYSMADQSTWRCAGVSLPLEIRTEMSEINAETPSKFPVYRILVQSGFISLVRPNLCITLHFKMENCNASPAPPAQPMILNVMI